MDRLNPELKQAAQALGHALKDAPSLQVYTAAVARMAGDAQATTLLDELERVQSDMRVRQANGEVTPADTARLRQLQQEVQAHPTIATFLAAQQNVLAYLPEVNQALGDLLGVDFASLGRVSTCC